MSDSELHKIRLRVHLVLGAAMLASVAANVLAAEPTVVARCVAAWPPVALLLVVDVLGRVPLASGVAGRLAAGAAGLVALVAAVASFSHVRHVALEVGESELVAWILPLSVKPSPKKRESACPVPAPGANRPADRRRRLPRPRPHGGRAWGQDKAGRGRFRRSIRDGARSAANRPQQSRSRSSRCSSPAFPAALHRHRCNSFPRSFRSRHPPQLARPQPILRKRARG